MLDTDKCTLKLWMPQATMGLDTCNFGDKYCRFESVLGDEISNENLLFSQTHFE